MAKIILSLGTSNKTEAAYLQELRNYKIKTLVDVRHIPQSRFFPHFNRKNLSEFLERQGIRYVWMGDTIGNPKDDEGKRSLDGFLEHMKTDVYKQGVASLIDMLAENEGNFGITCAEAKESQCHRQFLLQDLKMRLSDADYSFC